jgi:enoyl-CoA hydratase/carnithine racemase
VTDSPSPATGTPSPDVLVERLPTGVVEIWLNRPERMNALGVETVRLLKNSVDDAIQHGATALVFRAKGRSFCAGADLKERRTMTAAQQYAHNRAINAAVNAVEAAPVPTIAVINGSAMGGGLELALACDIRFAAESAQIGLTEARIGAIPGAGGTQRLPRLVGVSHALHMMFAGETVSGKRAQEIGLVNVCVPDAQLPESVAHYVGILGQRSPAAARTLKKVVREGMAVSLSDGLELERQALSIVFGSADYAEGLAAFAEKRPPKFAR